MMTAYVVIIHERYICLRIAEAYLLSALTAQSQVHAMVLL